MKKIFFCNIKIICLMAFGLMVLSLCIACSSGSRISCDTPESSALNSVLLNGDSSESAGEYFGSTNSFENLPTNTYNAFSTYFPIATDSTIPPEFSQESTPVSDAETDASADSETSCIPSESATETSSVTTHTTTPTTAPTATAPDSGYNGDESTIIKLSDSGSTVSNNNGGVSFQNGDVYILSAGTYDVKGILTDHSIIVDAPETDKVYVNLCGVTISSKVSHPIYVASADKVEISAQNGTANTVNDNRTTTDMDSATGGAIYSCADLEIKGKGRLTVNASYNNGIATKDDLIIKNLTLKVTAPNNALKGNDTVTVESGTITAISTLGDGIKTEGTDVSDKGNQRGVITISGGNINIYAACDAIDASYDVIINGGNVNAYTEAYSEYSGEVSVIDSSRLYLRFSTRSGGRPGGSSSGSSFSHSSYKYSARFTLSDGSYSWANFSQDTNAGNYVYYSAKRPSEATKIIVFAYSSTQTAGQSSNYAFCTDLLSVNTSYDTLAYSTSSSGNKTITFNWTNYTTSSQGGMGGGMSEGNANAAEYSCKGIKADNSVTISGGTISIKAHDDAIHANNDVLFEDGVSYGKGIININGGTLVLSSDDDGIHADSTLNVSGGKVTVTMSYEGVEAPNLNFKNGTLNITSSDDAVNACGATSAKVTISGGVIYFNAGGDGLDSNGTIIMSGGVVMAQGPSSGGNGVLDFDGSFTFNGGFLLTVGCSGMNQKPTASSGNTVTTKSISTTTSSYVIVTIDGNEVAVLKITKNSQNYCVLAYNNAEYGSGTATVSVTTTTSKTLTDGLYYFAE